LTFFPPQGNLAPEIEFGEIEGATVITQSESIASNDNDTTLPVFTTVISAVKNSVPDVLLVPSIVSIRSKSAI